MVFCWKFLETVVSIFEWTSFLLNSSREVQGLGYPGLGFLGCEGTHQQERSWFNGVFSRGRERELGMLISCIKGCFRSSAWIAVGSGWQGWQIQVSWRALTHLCARSGALGRAQHPHLQPVQGPLCSLEAPSGEGIYPCWWIKAGWLCPPFMDGETDDIPGVPGVLLLPCTARQEKGAGLSLAELEVLQPPPGIKLSVSILLHCVFLHQGWKGLSLICFSL